MQCLDGEILDVLVDLRVGSPTFGQWMPVTLTSTAHNAVLIPIGFGHAFQALSDTAMVMYCCNTAHNPPASTAFTHWTLAWPLRGRRSHRCSRPRMNPHPAGLTRLPPATCRLSTPANPTKRHNVTELRRWVVFRAGGMLGTDLVDALRQAGNPVLALRHHDADITRAESVRARVRPGDIVANCAAWTRVDDAETHRDAAFALNAGGPRVLAQACVDLDAILVHYSTDYVFGDAESGTPIAIDAPMHPTCVYGESKPQANRMFAPFWATRPSSPASPGCMGRTAATS